MASEFSLDDIRAAAEEKFGGTKIAGVELRNIIRLSKEERAELKRYQESKDEEEAEGEDVAERLFDRLSDLVRILAADKAAANELLNTLDRDATLLATIIEKYMDDQSGPKAQ